MSGRGKGNKGLGKGSINIPFDISKARGLFLQILPKKYHRIFYQADISDLTVASWVTRIFKALDNRDLTDVREDIENYLDIQNVRFMNITKLQPTWNRLISQKIQQQFKQIVRQKKKHVMKQIQQQVAFRPGKVGYQKTKQHFQKYK
jgi:hypothetical protein